MTLRCLQAVADLRAFNRQAHHHGQLGMLFQKDFEPGRALVLASALRHMGHQVGLRNCRVAFTRPHQTLTCIAWALCIPTAKADLWLGLDGTIGAQEILQSIMPRGYSRPAPVSPLHWSPLEDIDQRAAELEQIHASQPGREFLRFDLLVRQAVSVMQQARMEAATSPSGEGAARRL